MMLCNSAIGSFISHITKNKGVRSKLSADPEDEETNHVSVGEDCFNGYDNVNEEKVKQDSFHSTD